MKTCSSCREAKDASQFNRRTKSKDGLQSYCKTCADLSNRAFQQSLREPAKKRGGWRGSQASLAALDKHRPSWPHQKK